MLVVGNWKVNTDLGEAIRLASAVARTVGEGPSDVGLCPPFVWLEAVAERLKGSRVRLGAQNVYPAASGAFTGEVSPAMLAGVGCRYVIVGHSERRQLLGETDAFVAQKVAAVEDAGLTPILCVGETLDVRDRGDDAALAVVGDQLVASLVGASASVVVAYEPIWAIGTGRTASPEQAQALHAGLRARLADRFGEPGRSIPLLYGGSVKPSNAADLFRQTDIDGALVGGASLDAEAFTEIVAAADGA